MSSVSETCHVHLDSDIICDFFLVQFMAYILLTANKILLNLINFFLFKDRFLIVLKISLKLTLSISIF